MQSVRKLRRSWLVWLVIPITLLVIAGVIFVVFAPKVSTPSTELLSIESTIKEPQPTSISSNVLFLGNTYWGRYINDWSMASPLKYAYPFSRLNEFNRDQYDAWISGLECPTVAGVSMTSYQEDQTLTFNCSPDYLPEVAKWFTAFTLANNHTDNQGIDGFAETRERLEENGIQHFGHYDPRLLSDICEVISLPVTVVKDDSSETSGNLPITVCAYHGVFRLPTEDSVAVMKKYSQYMPIIAMPHMGAEYKTTPDELKTSFYRSLIDGGADMVLGDHPHWIQTSESYKGHLIVYSMGNFIFDQQDTAEVVRSAGIRVVMNITDDDSDLLNKWLAIGETCKAFQDDCLQQIKDQKLSKLDITYKFGVVGTNNSNKIVKPATAVQQAEILDRLNWQTTVKGLQPPYGSL